MELYKEFYEPPFTPLAMNELLRYFPETEAEIETGEHSKRDDFIMHFFMIRLAALSRSHHGFAGCSFRNGETAFKKDNIQKPHRQKGFDEVNKARITDVALSLNYNLVVFFFYFFR